MIGHADLFFAGDADECSFQKTKNVVCRGTVSGQLDFLNVLAYRNLPCARKKRQRGYNYSLDRTRVLYPECKSSDLLLCYTLRCMPPALDYDEALIVFPQALR